MPTLTFKVFEAEARTTQAHAHAHARAAEAKVSTYLRSCALGALAAEKKVN